MGGAAYYATDPVSKAMRRRVTKSWPTKAELRPSFGPLDSSIRNSNRLPEDLVMSELLMGNTGNYSVRSDVCCERYACCIPQLRFALVLFSPLDLHIIRRKGLRSAPDLEKI